MDLITRISNLQADISRLNADRERKQGRLDSVKEKLRQMGYEDTQAAETALQAKINELKEMEESISAEVNKIESEIAGIEAANR
jgi:predicted  nucleic acid-binding Zn-ribbon protein